MHEKKYTIGKTILTQQELTLGQAIRVRRLIGDPPPQETPAELLDRFTRETTLDEFFRIILKGDLPDEQVTEWLPASVGMEIIADFFLFNSALIQGWLLYLETAPDPGKARSGKP